MTKAINLTTATFTASEAQGYLPLAAQATIKGKEAIDTAKGKQASAFAVMVAGFASDEAATSEWSFDIRGNNGDVHYHVVCCGTAEFGNDNLEWKRNSQGAISKVAQSAYKAGLQSYFFNLPEPNPAVWTAASRAIPIARAIREEGMTATIENGELKLEGGTSERAEKMRDAKTVAAMKKAVAGETGTNRDKPQNEKSDGEEVQVATPAEVLRAAWSIVAGVTNGEEAICNAALSYARRIAELVAANPDAFADD